MIVCMFGPDDLPIPLFTARHYERQVISKAPVSGVVLKLTDVTDLTLEDAVGNFWQLLNQNASLETIALVATTNNLVLDQQHNPELHAALAKRFIRPETAAYLIQQAGERYTSGVSRSLYPARQLAHVEVVDRTLLWQR
jgi:hypothetical protein